MNFQKNSIWTELANFGHNWTIWATWIELDNLGNLDKIGQFGQNFQNNNQKNTQKNLVMRCLRLKFYFR